MAHFDQVLQLMLGHQANTPHLTTGEVYAHHSEEINISKTGKTYNRAKATKRTKMNLLERIPLYSLIHALLSASLVDGMLSLIQNKETAIA